MTLPQHALQTGLLCMLFPKLRKGYFIIAAELLTVLPDVGRLFQNNPDDWTQFYQWAHSSWYCYCIPFWNLHIAEDYFVHQPGGGWYWWAYPVEALFWITEIIICFSLYKRKARLQGKEKFFF